MPRTEATSFTTYNFAKWYGTVLRSKPAWNYFSHLWMFVN